MKYLTYIIILFSLHELQGQSTAYVNKAASSGKMDGSSWSDAFLNIGDALEMSKADTILVMAGTYKLSKTNDPKATLDLTKISALVGGFSIVDNVVVKDSKIFLTVVDGDIGVEGDTTDNSYQLMTCKKTGGSLLIDGFVFTNANGITALPPQNKGAALAIDYSNLQAPLEIKINDCNFSNNRSYAAGAVYLTAVAASFPITLDISRCKFQRNYSRFIGGGAIIMDPFFRKTDSVLIESCEFTNNISGNNGGAILIHDLVGFYSIKNCLFSDNYSIADGGSICNLCSNVATGTLQMEYCVFTRNVASNSNFSILRSDPRNSIADSCTLDLSHCIFDNNESTRGDGAALFYWNATGYSLLKMKRCDFINNKSFNDGGAVFIENYSSLRLNIDQSKFIGNKAAPSATGALFFQAGLGIDTVNEKNFINISNSLFCRNRAGIAFNNGDFGTMLTNIDNCTFSSNGDYVLGKSYNPKSDYVTNYNAMYVRNSILWAPTASKFTMFYNGVPTKTSIADFFVSNCLLSTLDLKVGSHDADRGGNIYSKYPMFQDTAALNFGLKPCSPAINKASRFTVDSLGILVDILGNPRVFQDSVDMGAYESQEKCTVGTAELDQELRAILLKPNVCEPGTTIHLELDPHSENYQILIFDSSGQLYSQSVLFQQGFEAPSASGFYVVQVFDVHKKVVGVTKLVVVK